MNHPFGANLHCKSGWPWALLALALCLGWGQPMFAACGDYVALGAHADLASGHGGAVPPNAMASFGGDRSSHLQTEMPPQRFPTPCNGPECQRGPLPAPTAPAPPPAPVMQWGCIPGRAVLASPAVYAWQLTERLVRPVDEATSVFHPPRLLG